MSWSALNLSAPAGNAAAVDGANSAGLTMLLVHPWVQGVGEGDGHYQYLSFPNAIKKMVGENDLGMYPAVLAVGISAANYLDFAGQLNAFNHVFPIKELQKIQRRAQSTAGIEQSKWTLDDTADNVVRMAQKPAAMPMMRLLAKSSAAETALSAAETFKSSSAATNLNDFKARKVAHDAGVGAALADAKTLLSGGAGWRFYAESDVLSAFKSGHPGHDQVLTALLVFAGGVADLALLKEVLA